MSLEQKLTPLPEALDYARKRLKAWYAEQPDTPGKRLAEEVAAVWQDENPAAGRALFEQRVREMNLKRWEAGAVAQMVLAILGG